MGIRRVGASGGEIALPVAGAARRLGHGAMVHGDSRRQIPHVAAQYGYSQAQIHIARAGSRAQYVALAQDGSKVACQSRRAQLAGLDEHMRQARVSAQLRQHSSVSGDSRIRVDGLELTQQVARLRQRRGGRGIQPGKAGGIDRNPSN